MPKDKFLLVSLEEEKAKKLAQVLASETSRKILDHLSERSATETEISNALGVPISTIHYNLQQLVAANLVVSEEFTYSTKGREVNHYKLANKYIIIAPKFSMIGDKLKRLLPAALVALIGAGLIQFFTNKAYSVQIARVAPEALSAAQTSAASQPLVQAMSPPPFGLLFFIGAMTVMAVYALTEYFKKR